MPGIVVSVRSDARVVSLCIPSSQTTSQRIELSPPATPESHTTPRCLPKWVRAPKIVMLCDLAERIPVAVPFPLGKPRKGEVSMQLRLVYCSA